VVAAAGKGKRRQSHNNGQNYSFHSVSSFPEAGYRA